MEASFQIKSGKTTISMTILQNFDFIDCVKLVANCAAETPLTQSISNFPFE